MNDDLEDAATACFQADLVPTSSPSPSPADLEWSLPAEVAVLLQSATRRFEIPLYLTSALRILHFRHSGVGSASIAVVIKNEQPRDLVINIDGNMSNELVLEATKTLISEPEVPEHTSEKSLHAPNRLVIRYSQKDEGAETSAYQYAMKDDLTPSRAEETAMVWQFNKANKNRITYDETQYQLKTIKILTENLADVILAILRSPHLCVSDVKFPRALDQLRQFSEPLIPPTNGNLPTSLMDAFDQAVAMHSTLVAVVQGTFIATYHEVDVLSSLLAQDILKQREPSHQSDEFIAFSFPSSALAIVSILAIMKTGCAYVPIDIRQAPDRVTNMLEVTGNPCILISDETPEFLRSGNIQASTINIGSYLNNWRSRIVAADVTKPPRGSLFKLACCLFTSGTSGRPKGTRIMASNITSLASNTHVLSFKPGDRVAQMANLAWDAHILEIWCPLLHGASIISFNRFDVLDPVVLTVQFKLFGITTCFLSTAMFRHILNRSPQLFENVKMVLTGGEKARYEDFARARFISPEITISNLYGPTECCVFVSSITTIPSIDIPDARSPSIGRPVTTAQLIMLDPQGCLVPPGIIGEIYVRGGNVADGYEKMPQETNSAFVEKKILGVNESPSTFYRTGDQGRWNFNGEAEFMGRINSTQVKIRGQRFEVTDVEANIALRSEMKDIAVAYHKPKDQQDGALFGYVVPEPGSEIWKIQEKRDNNLVHTWEEHYDLEYTGDNIIKIRKNFLGWDSMITGKPIPHDEMQAWLDDTLRPFFYYRPQKVLEIGCGIGTMLWEMVPFVKHFYGIEPSQAGVRQVEVQLDRDGLGEKASLWHASADKIPELPPFEIDFVLVNSVTQYFPSLDYLRQVISDTLCRCKTQSHIVLGDIRSAPLDDLLAIDIYMHQWRENLREKTVQDLRNQAHWRHMYGTELLVDPSFFYDLQRRDPRISHVEIVPKMYPYDNELSRYRYQVILHVEKDLTLVTPAVWESPDDKNLLIANLPQRIKEFIFSDEDFLSLEKIPNRCISWATRVLEISSDPSTHHSKTLNALPQVDLEGQGWSPADLVELSNQYGLYVQLSTARQAEGGALDAVFFKSQVSNRYVIFPQPQTSSSYFQLNRNEQSTYKRRMLEEEKWKEMVQMLTTKLPPYMIPEAVYVVDKLPMTLNGKIDRKTMSRIAASDYEQKLKKRANIFGYQNETERIICYLFADFLGRAAAISPSTDFFLQGGHSLLATRLRAALQERFRIPIPMSVIFDSPTPHQLAFKVMDIQKQGRTLDRAVEKSYSGSGNLMEMSFAQFRLWFLELLSPSSARYNSGFALQFMKPVDEEVMEATIGKIAIRHDILRTIYVEVGGEPKAKVIQDLPKVKRVQIDGFALEEEVNAIIKEAMVIPFDWSVEPPFRPFLFRWGDNHILLLAQHHIISDGFSHDIWRKEISSIYPALLENEAPDVAELPIQYQDYAKWQRSEEFEEMIKSQLAYWVSHLQGSRPARFPKDFVRTSQVGPGGTHILSCDQTLKDKLNDICKEYNLTWYMLLIASFRAVHFTWTGQSDACLGNPVANRHLAELEPLLGFFVNTQVFRLKCQQGMPFPALLRHARDLALKALENQDVPFDRLVEILKPRRSAAQNPLVEMMFAFQTNETSPFFLTSDISARPFGVDMKTSRFDLEVHWSEEPGQLRCVFCYREDVFTADTIQTLGDKVMGFLQTIAEDHNISISSEHTEDDVLAFDDLQLEDLANHGLFCAAGPDGPPENDIEKTICELFQAVLGRPSIMRQSNFFDCGGHSLLVTFLCAKLGTVFEREFRASDVFNFPTPAALAVQAQALLEKEPQPEGKGVATYTGDDAFLPSHFAFKSMPGKPWLFCVPAWEGLGTLFYKFAVESNDFNLVALNDPMLRNDKPISEAASTTTGLLDLAHQFYQQIEQIDLEMAQVLDNEVERTSPLPLNILGYSYGGTVAIETARWATQAGRRVNLFVVDSMDTSLSVTEETCQGISNLFKPKEIDSTVREAAQDASRTVMPFALTRVETAWDPASPEHYYVRHWNKAKILDRALPLVGKRLYDLMRHNLKPYVGPVVLFRTEGNALHGFHDKIKELEEIRIDGSHFHILDQPGREMDKIIKRISMAVALQVESSKVHERIIA